MSAIPSGRGRPTSIDPACLERVAIELFRDRGFDTVSMDEIARAAGVSRRSLFRYFQTKADLVWGGYEPVIERVHAALGRVGPEDDAIDAMVDATIDSFSVLAATIDLTRTRLQIIDTHPELQALGSERLAGVSGELSGYIETRLPHLSGTVRPHAIADAVSAVTFAALRFWATATDDPTPERVVRDALDTLLRGIRAVASG
jgi:AcrR family transcriptional regulator